MMKLKDRIALVTGGARGIGEAAEIAPDDASCITGQAIPSRWRPAARLHHACRAVIRLARTADMPAITRIRTSVGENHLSLDEMARRGITPQGIIADIAAGHLGAWVAEEAGEVVAFAMADQRDGSIFALFTAPGHEARGHGARLLDQAMAWLKSQGHAEAWLSTGRATRAARFYAKRGWMRDGGNPTGDEDVIYRRPIAEN